MNKKILLIAGVLLVVSLSTTLLYFKPDFIKASCSKNDFDCLLSKVENCRWTSIAWEVDTDLHYLSKGEITGSKDGKCEYIETVQSVEVTMNKSKEAARLALVDDKETLAELESFYDSEKPAVERSVKRFVGNPSVCLFTKERFKEAIEIRKSQLFDPHKKPVAIPWVIANTTDCVDSVISVE